MKKDKWINILLVLILLAGLSLLLYPSFSDYWNSLHQSYAVASYVEKLSAIENEEYRQMKEAALAYNRSIPERDLLFALSEEEKAQYDALLRVDDSGMMGYVEIPAIDVSLPVYHGTEEAVLQVAIGHLDWTSLPIGGESSHCVISGHRGLPSARLFSDLNKLVVGDYFELHTLDEVLSYEVDQIRIVEPQETDELLIQEGKDLCTLVTCTPYGINSHRLLVRGHRVENRWQDPAVRVTADAVVLEKLVVAPFLLLPILLVMLSFLLVPRKNKNRRNVK